MKVFKDLVIAQYEYEPEPGVKKTRWLKVGKIFIDDDKDQMKVKIDSIPTTVCAPGSGETIPWDGWIKAFDPKPNSPSATDFGGGMKNTMDPKPKARRPSKKAKRVTKADREKALALNKDDVPF